VNGRLPAAGCNRAENSNDRAGTKVRRYDGHLFVEHASSLLKYDDIHPVLSVGGAALQNTSSISVGLAIPRLLTIMLLLDNIITSLVVLILQTSIIITGSRSPLSRGNAAG
jgi:hypothetical protein